MMIETGIRAAGVVTLVAVGAAVGSARIGWDIVKWLGGWRYR